MSETEQATMVTCPSCKGQPRGWAFACGPGVSRMMETVCRVCRGAGEVSADLALVYAERRAQRQARIERGESQRDAAERLGMSEAATRTPNPNRDAWITLATEERDPGCEVAPRCVECPLPVCRLELPGKALIMARRGLAVWAAYGDGLTADEAGKRLGMSRRQLYRVSAYTGLRWGR